MRSAIHWWVARFLILGCAASVSLSASDWPRFRGPNGTGLAAERPLPAQIGPGQMIWKVPSAGGHSSPVIVKDRVFITAQEGDERSTFCYSAADGSLLWRRAVAKARSETANPLNGSATPSPASDGRLIFVFFPEFGLLAYDLEGNEQWRVPLGPFGHIQGMASSPIHADGKVVLLVDTPEQAYLAAYEAGTGAEAWKVERPIGFLGSYATPSVYEPANGPVQLVVAGAVELTGYRAATGERLWWARGVTSAPAALPLVAGGSVYTVEPVDATAPSFQQMLGSFDQDGSGKIELAELQGEAVGRQIMKRLFWAVDRHLGDGDAVVSEEEYGRAFQPDQSAGGLVRMDLGGQGDVSRTHLRWRHTKGLPYVTAPLLYQDVLYVVRNGGILSTFDPETGAVLREERLKDALGDYYASPVAADGKIYFASKEGRITVIAAGKDWSILGSTDLSEQVIATPAIAGGRIFVRTEDHLYCFGGV